jgi:hypothetical protein
MIVLEAPSYTELLDAVQRPVKAAAPVHVLTRNGGDDT